MDQPTSQPKVKGKTQLSSTQERYCEVSKQTRKELEKCRWQELT